MKTTALAISIALTFLSCSSGDKKSNVTYTLEKFPKEWIEVEQENGKWIIFEPCDAGTPELYFSEKNGKNIFAVSFGQDGAEYNLEQFIQSSDSSVTIEIKPEDETEILKYLFFKTGSENIWKVKTPDNIESFYVDKRNAAGLAKVIQPCRECWGDEMCGEEEKNK